MNLILRCLDLANRSRYLAWTAESPEARTFWQEDAALWMGMCRLLSEAPVALLSPALPKDPS